MAQTKMRPTRGRAARALGWTAAAALALLTAGSLAGCLSLDGGSPAPPLTWTQTFHLTTDGRLSATPVEAGELLFPGGLSGLATGFRVLEFVGEPFARAALWDPVAANVTLVVRTDGPGVPLAGIDAIAWAGSTHGLTRVGTGGSSAPAMPGDVREVSIGLPAPAGAMVIRAGESVRLVLLQTLMDERAEAVRLLVGGASPSRIDVTFTEALGGGTPQGVTTDLTFSGTLRNAPGVQLTPLGCSAGPADGTNIVTARHVVDIPVGATYLEARLHGTPTTPEPADLDLAVYAGPTLLMRGPSPGTQEAFILGPDVVAAVAGSTVDLVVVACQGADVQYVATLIHDAP